MNAMRVLPFLCRFTLIAFSGMNLVRCLTCGEDSSSLESADMGIKEAQAEAGGIRENPDHSSLILIPYLKHSLMYRTESRSLALSLRKNHIHEYR